MLWIFLPKSGRLGFISHLCLFMIFVKRKSAAIFVTVPPLFEQLLAYLRCQQVRFAKVRMMISKIM